MKKNQSKENSGKQIQSLPLRTSIPKNISEQFSQETNSNMKIFLLN